MTASPSPPIAPRQLQALLLTNAELALLDVREARAFVDAHLNLARMAPLSGLELEVRDTVPRLGTPVVLVDGGEPDGPASIAATLLRRMGYTDVRVLAGGIAGWNDQALPLIDGYGTLVKAFGDQVRRHRAVPSVQGDALRHRLLADGKPILIDVRPADEYAFLSLAGAGNHAGTELALRDWSADMPTAPWVINCFTRTRGIIGTATLRLLGHPDAHFLEDGVMRWALDGAPAVQNARPAVALPAAHDDVLRRRADALIARHALPLVDAGALSRLQADADRTLYLFDLRPQAVIDAARPGVRAVPGGQLLMHFEQWVGTRGARIVLLDEPHRLRAAVTAFWLTQLNQAEVFILDGELPARWLADANVADADRAGAADRLSPLALAALLQDTPARTSIVDVGPSADFERRHLPRAHYLLPFTLEPLAALQPEAHRIVFTSPDGRAARLAARDARARWPGCAAQWLDGGTDAWLQAGLPIEQTWEPAQLLTSFEDDWGSVMRVPASRRDRTWADYLRWERALSARVALDPTVKFRLL